MGTLAVTYDGTTKNITMSNAPVIAYGGKTLVSAGSWEGDKTLKCGGKWMISDVTIGNRALKTEYTWAKSDIQMNYVKASASSSLVATESTTITVPEGYNKVQFFAVGGGGGSAAAYSGDSEEYSNGAGGGGGYTNEVILSTVPGTEYTLSIGPGGKSGGDGTASIVYQGSVEVLRAEGGKASSGTTYSVKPGSGGSGGGASFGSGGTNGGNGYNASSGSTYSYGIGQGTTTKCSFLENSPAYAGGGGGSRASYDTYRYDSSVSADTYIAAAKASANYKSLVGGEYGGGHGTYTYMYGVYFDSSTDGDPLYDRYPRCINGTSGTTGSGGGAGGGCRRYYDPKNGVSGWAGYSGLNLSGGSGVIIYRFYEE